MSAAANYRPEIDGLRAIAILLVIMYHASFKIAGYSLLPGGYIGVDVFFVISGYLISRILLFELKKESFTFIKFYERRARRILPALLTVTAVTTIFAWNILMPDSLLEYGQSLLATALFSANIFFLRLDNYTAELIAHRPLLHMWSLGIEEQFYIVFPPLLLLVYKKFRNHLFLFLAAGFLLSLLFAELCSGRYPGINFYLAPSRGWELMAGGLLACLEARGLKFTQSRLSGFLPLPALFSILVFASLADDGLRHPSLYTLLPVLGTMALIWYADPRSSVTRLMSTKPLVWTGLISYSLYLWHQPVFALVRVQLERELLNYEKTVLIAGCFLLAGLTYHLIERPTRNRAVTSSRTIWQIAAVGSFSIAVIGLTIHAGSGFPARYYSAKLIDDAMYGRYAPDTGGRKCKNFHPEKGHCQFTGVTQSGYTLFTVGDSHLRTLDAPIIAALGKLEFVADFIPLNSGTSFFSFDLDILVEEGQKLSPLGLVSYNRARYEKILDFDNQIIITGGRLPIYLENERFDNGEGGREQGGKCYFIKADGEKYEKLSPSEITISYKKSIKRLLQQGIKVILIYPIPEIGWDVPKEITKTIEAHADSEIAVILKTYPLTTSYELFQKRTASAYRVYNSVADHPNLLRIYPEKLFCHDGRCHTHNSTSLYYRDDNHLSYYGAAMLLEHTLKQMRSKWPELAEHDTLKPQN